MSRRRGHRGGHHEEHENHERWLITYADMITLLMVFFIVLYASSVVNVSKLRAISNSAAKALGAGPSKDMTPTQFTKTGGTPGPAALPKPVAHPGTKASLDAQALLKLLRARIKAAGLSADVTAGLDPRGVVLYFTDRVLFDSAQAVVLPRGAAVLDALAPILIEQPNPLVVEGHTDDQPIVSAQYPTNWELSTARATNVLRYLVERHRLAAARVSAAGYADTHPRAANSTAANRARNRRVEIVVLVPAGAAAVPGTSPR